MVQVISVNHVLEAELRLYLGFIALIDLGVFDVVVEKLNSQKCLNGVWESTFHAQGLVDGAFVKINAGNLQVEDVVKHANLSITCHLGELRKRVSIGGFEVVAHSKLRKVVSCQKLFTLLRNLLLELFYLLGAFLMQSRISGNELVISLDHSLMMSDLTLYFLHVEPFQIHGLLEDFLRPVQFGVELIPLLLKFPKGCLVFLAIINSTMKFLPGWHLSSVPKISHKLVEFLGGRVLAFQFLPHFASTNTNWTHSTLHLLDFSLLLGKF